MFLWIIFAVLTALAAVLVVSPYWRRSRGAGAQGHDAEVYKQQLAELDEEQARGLIGDAEAEAARIEAAGSVGDDAILMGDVRHAAVVRPS